MKMKYHLFFGEYFYIISYIQLLLLSILRRLENEP